MEIDHEWPVNLNVRGACHSVAGIGTATVLGDLLVAETFHARTSRLCRSLHSNTGSTWQRSGGDLFGDRIIIAKRSYAMVGPGPACMCRFRVRQCHD